MPRSTRVVVAALLALAVVLGVPGRARAVAVPDTVCDQDWRPAEAPVGLDPLGRPGGEPLPPAPSPDHRPFHVFCADHYVATVWRAPSVGTIEAVRLARELGARAAWPSARPGVNPTVGITGIPGWFWVTPDPAVTMRPGNGPGFTLDLRVTGARWSFGDGGTASGLGVAFPVASPVTHLWRRTGTYPVTVTIEVSGRVRFEELDLPLPTGRHVREFLHDVAQVRSLLHTV